MDRWRQGSSSADRRSGIAPNHIHLARIAERGMAGLAQVLVQGGAVVTGSEPSPGPAVDRLRRLGVRVHVHHGQPRPCPRSARLLVCGAEVGRTDPERLSARRRGLALWTPAHCLAGLLRRGSGIAVAGGRAASVAAAMIGWTLTRAGLDPTIVLGTAAPQLGGWARLGRGPHVVVEAVPGNAVGEGWGGLAPRLAVLLDDDREASREGWIEALRALARSVPREGVVLAPAGGGLAFEEEALRGQGVAVEWLALERGADWWGADLREDRGRFRFRAFRRERFVVEVRLRVPGLRNVLSALSAVATCIRLDVPAPEVQLALEEFTGISGDFESRGSYRGVTLVDDAGDDPASVDEALRLGRRVFGDRRIWAVLLATGATLDPEAQDRYTAALLRADEVLLAEREAEAAQAPGRGGPVPTVALAAALAAAGRRARCAASLDDAILDLDRHLEPGDVLVTLGAGDVGTISDAFIRRLPRDRPGR